MNWIKQLFQKTNKVQTRGHEVTATSQPKNKRYTVSARNYERALSRVAICKKMIAKREYDADIIKEFEDELKVVAAAVKTYERKLEEGN